MATTPRITGTLKPVRKSVKVSYDPQRGKTIRTEYESAGNNLTGLATECEAQKAAYELTANPVKSTLSVTAAPIDGGGAVTGGAGDVATDTWQVLANEIQRSIWESPIALAACGANLIGIAANALKKNTSIADFAAGVDAIALPAERTAGADVAVVGYYTLATKGATHYTLGQYVLRHTTNIGAWSTSANVSDVGIGRVYTTSQLLSEVTNASFWLYPCPARLQTKITFVGTSSVPVGFTWGWLKKPSTETTAANYRVDISTEYWLEAWSTLLYPAYIPAA